MATFGVSELLSSRRFSKNHNSSAMSYNDWFAINCYQVGPDSTEWEFSSTWCARYEGLSCLVICFHCCRAVRTASHCQLCTERVCGREKRLALIFWLPGSFTSHPKNGLKSINNKKVPSEVWKASLSRCGDVRLMLPSSSLLLNVLEDEGCKEWWLWSVGIGCTPIDWGAVGW